MTTEMRKLFNFNYKEGAENQLAFLKSCRERGAKTRLNGLTVIVDVEPSEMMKLVEDYEKLYYERKERKR